MIHMGESGLTSAGFSGHGDVNTPTARCSVNTSRPLAWWMVYQDGRRYLNPEPCALVPQPHSFLRFFSRTLGMLDCLIQATRYNTL